MTVPAGRHAPRLTARQAEVVGLVARGFTNEQIGGLLGISERGVRAQISRLLKRFGVPNRTGLTRAALESGFGFDVAELSRAARLGVQPQVAIPPAQEARLYDAAPFMVAIMSPDDLRITYANRRFAQTLGWRAERVMGKSYADIFPDASPERVAARDRAAREGVLKGIDHEVTSWTQEDGSSASAVLTYIIHPLWTLTGTIDALLFIGSAHPGSGGGRGSVSRIPSRRVMSPAPPGAATEGHGRPARRDRLSHRGRLRRR